MRGVLSSLAVVALAPLALAQSGGRGNRCAYQFSANHPTQSSKTPSGQYNVLTGGSVVAKCRVKGSVVTADSLEYYGDEGRTVLIGHATYVDPRLRLKSDQLTYFETDERILATQNVVATLPSGSTIVGPQLEFLRAVPRLRPAQQATATGRPTISLVERDAQGRTQPPVKVTGNTVWLLGDSIVSSQGNVVVVRPQLTATGDSIFADAGSGLLRIMRKPKIVGTKGRPFTLVGETIDLLTKQKKLDRVLAKSNAEAQSEDLNLKSDTIDMRVTGDLLQRAIVWGKSRAHATSPTQAVVADSIDVLLPRQRVRELHAVRGASAEGMPDTAKFVFDERDRLTGDTIIARFDAIAATDSTSKPKIDRLLAIGHATSLQHIAPNDSSLCRAAVVYARGRLIEIAFRAGVVDSVRVTDRDALAGGLQLEPKADSANACRVLRGRRAPASTTTTLAPGKPAPPPAPGAVPPLAAPPAALPPRRP
jgi:lipopolysaccharide export system protein LptA